MTELIRRRAGTRLQPASNESRRVPGLQAQLREAAKAGDSRGFFVQLPEAVLFDPRLNPTTKMFFAGYAGLARHKGYSYASSASVANRFGTSESTAKDAARCLDHIGLLVLEEVVYVAHRVVGDLREVYDDEYMEALRVLLASANTSAARSRRNEAEAFFEELRAQHLVECPVESGRASRRGRLAVPLRPLTGRTRG